MRKILPVFFIILIFLFSQSVEGEYHIGLYDPNPANGTYNTNYLDNNSGAGLTAAITANYNNFTIPPAVLPGDYSMTIIGSEPDNTPVVWNTSTTGVYMDVHDDTTGQLTPGNPYVGQYPLAGEYTIMRSFVIFNTSSIPPGATINSGYLQLYVYDTTGVVDDFNVTIQECRSPCPRFPTLLSTDFWNHGFTGDMGNMNTTGYVDDDMFLISLNASGVANILGGDWRATESVRWALTSSRDYAAIAPVNDEFIVFYGYGVDTAKHPRLIINYTVPVSNWNYIVNLSWLNNESGTWQQFALDYITANGTYSHLNTNLTDSSTRYWLRVVSECNGTILDNETWWFETSDGCSGNVTTAGFSFTVPTSSTIFSIALIILAWTALLLSWLQWRQKFICVVLAVSSMILFFAASVSLVYVTEGYAVYNSALDVVATGEMHLASYTPYSMIFMFLGIFAMVWVFIRVFDFIFETLTGKGMIQE